MSTAPGPLTAAGAGADLDDPRTDPAQAAARAAQTLREATGVASYDIALVLGSGWSAAADLLGRTVATVPATEVPGFARSGVPGHPGTLRAVEVDAGGQSKYALVVAARTHYYENRGVRRVAHGVRTAAAAGAKTMVLTNGCGGLELDWPPGTPVLVSDHLNLTAASPIEGPDFVDLTDLYSSRLRGLAREVGGDLPEGVYAQFRGPHYETPAEVQMAKRMGADLVGMSTALEAIAARQAGMEVLGISLVTNLAAGISPEPLSHEEVIAAGRAAGPRISSLLTKIVHQVLR
ncbi:MAG TPA: purine-nucleoside phosphorylase [Beutenbergiaceae bacterium]|nr:purine-nucleoside phosphorylase [Beutenbergiaceae bacterium]